MKANCTMSRVLYSRESEREGESFYSIYVTLQFIDISKMCVMSKIKSALQDGDRFGRVCPKFKFPNDHYQIY